MRTLFSRRPTFLVVLLLALFFTGFPVQGGVKKQLIVTGAASADGVCGTKTDGAIIALYDASSISDCDATGGGTTTAWCGCDSAVRTALSLDGDLTDGDKGDITVASSGAAWTVDANAIALGTDTTGGYAASATEGGAATGLVASGAVEHAVTNVTVADDAAGTKPTGAIPITTDYATCTCNDATGCTMSIAEPTPTSGYGRELTVISIGTGNCEIADSGGVVELGTTLVIEPTSTARFAYAGSAWYNTSYKDNVP